MSNRELDAMVDADVMGRNVHCYVTGDWCRSDSTGLRDFFIPSYSTEIGAAWLVVDRLRSMGWVVEVVVDNGIGQYCKVSRMTTNGIVTAHAEEPTVPLAICRAALRVPR